jgi:amidophosphoribosyltransferase
MYNNEFEKDTPWDDLHEECGVFGMYDFAKACVLE